MTEPIILASKSPRRKHLLELAEIPFEIIVEDTAEEFPDGLSFNEIPIYISEIKAKVIKQKHPHRSIVSADTIVVINDKILGKPTNQEEAMEFLGILAGATHRVITGVSILSPSQTISFSDVTEVTFHPLTRHEIEYYVRTYNPLDKAGAYAIQEWIGAIGIKRIHGCFYNVMGLPISRVKQALAQIGF